MVSVFLRPNPSVDWRPFNDKVYDPVWKAAADTGLVLAIPPVPHARPPGRMSRCSSGARSSTAATPSSERPADGWFMSNIYFTQAIANPVDVMHSICYVTAGGVAERFATDSCSSRPTGAGWCRGWSGSTTTRRSSSGTCRG